MRGASGEGAGRSGGGNSRSQAQRLMRLFGSEKDEKSTSHLKKNRGSVVGTWF